MTVPPVHTAAVADAAVDAIPGAVPCRAAARPWVLAATILASSMVFIDGTVVNVALPALQRAFNADASDLQWVVEAYALLLAALLLVGGTAGDRFGRRRVFLIGVCLFALASGWCGLAGGVHALVWARALQGVGGALLVPGSLALISAAFPEKERGRAIGTWSGFTAITAAVGPVLGGYLIEHYSWRLAFLINLPLALLVLGLSLAYVPESRDPQAPAKLDWGGALLASLGLGGVVFGLIESSTRGWADPAVLAALLTGLALLAAFVVVERRSAAPMLPLSLFRSLDFAGANLLTLLLYAALGGSLYFLPLNLIQVQGYSAIAAGAALLPFVLLMFLLSRWSGGLVDRYGARGPLVIGPAIAALGFAGLAIPSVGGSYWSTYFPAVLVLGFGMCVAVAPLTTTVMNAVGERQAGAASGVNNAVSRAAALLAVAVFGIVMSAAFNATLSTELKRSDAVPALVQSVWQQRNKLAAIAVPAGADAVQAEQVKKIVAASYIRGFRAVMLLAALLALASALCAWLTIGRRGPSGDAGAGPH
jgi:EmrB/QacA subfamily drug resistance transporter